jgi:hypothetical protein
MSMLPIMAIGRSAWLRINSHATIAPIDQPTTTASSSARWCISAAKSAASLAMVAPDGRNAADKPCPA